MSSEPWTDIHMFTIPGHCLFEGAGGMKGNLRRRQSMAVLELQKGKVCLGTATIE